VNRDAQNGFHDIIFVQFVFKRHHHLEHCAKTLVVLRAAIVVSANKWFFEGNGQGLNA